MNKQLEAITLPDGKEFEYIYNNGKLRWIKDSAQRTTTFSYDARGFLASAVYPGGDTKRFRYSNDGLMVAEENERGFETRLAYNDFNRLQTVTNAENKSISVYDMGSQNLLAEANQATITPASIGLDESQVHDVITDANGNSTHVLRGLHGFVATVFDAKGNKTEVYRDDNNRVTRVVRPDGSDVKTTYNPITGDVIKTVDVTLGITEEFAYNSFGLPISHKNARGQISNKTYDSLGNLVSLSSPLNQTVTYARNSRGQVTSETVSNGTDSRTTTFEYNTNGELIRKTMPDGKYVTFTYSVTGHRLSSNADGKITTYSYDQRNRLIGVTTALNETTSYEYLPVGQLSKIIDPKGRETIFTYSAAGNLISKRDPAGALTQYTYDNNGNTLTETNPRGQLKQISYNELNQVVGIQTPDDQQFFTYDVNGEVLAAQNLVSQVTYQRDSRKRLTGLSVVGRGTMSSYPTHGLSYSYDQNDNKTAMASTYGQIAYGYDNLDRLVYLSNSAGDVYNYEHDVSGRVSQLSRSASSTVYAFADNTNLTSINHVRNSNSASLGYFNYGYDGRQLPVQKQSQLGNLNYGYDANGQLTSVTGLSSESFTYDSLGNRLTDTNGSYNYEASTQRLLEDWQYTYQYDASGNMIAKLPKNPAGKAYQFSYTASNQLYQVKILASALGQIEKEIFYTYDVLGRRMQKQLVDHLGSSSYLRKYIYDGENILAELDSSNNMLARYTHSPLAPDDILSVEITTDGVSAGIGTSIGKFYYLKDAIGSIADIQDHSGAKVQSYEYSSFGKVNFVRNAIGQDVTSNPQIKTPFMFAGREYEQETGMYFNRARYYDPSIGRFLQEDPYAGEQHEPMSVINKYGYSANRPTIITDPSGKFWWILAFAFLGGAQGYQAGVDAGFTGGKLLGSVLLGAVTSVAAPGATQLWGVGAGLTVSFIAGGLYQAGIQTLAYGRVVDGSRVLAGAGAGFVGGAVGYGGAHFGYTLGLTTKAAGIIDDAISIGLGSFGGGINIPTPTKREVDEFKLYVRGYPYGHSY